MKKVLALMLAMALVLGAALSGCGSSGEEVTSTTAAAAEENTQNTQTADNLTGMEAEFAEGQAHKGGKLTMGETGDVGEFFSPYKQGTLVTYGWAVYEPLAWLSSDGTWTPCLAESWERDDENFMLTGLPAFSVAILESRINIICRSQKLSDKKLALRCICPWFPPVFHSRWVFCSV